MQGSREGSESSQEALVSAMRDLRIDTGPESSRPQGSLELGRLSKDLSDWLDANGAFQLCTRDDTYSTVFHALYKGKPDIPGIKDMFPTLLRVASEKIGAETLMRALAIGGLIEEIWADGKCQAVIEALYSEMQAAAGGLGAPAPARPSMDESVARAWALMQSLGLAAGPSGHYLGYNPAAVMEPSAPPSGYVASGYYQGPFMGVRAAHRSAAAGREVVSLDPVAPE